MNKARGGLILIFLGGICLMLAGASMMVSSATSLMGLWGLATAWAGCSLCVVAAWPLIAGRS